MKVSNIVGERFKDRPSYCVNDSQALLVKGGYVKQVSNGVYSINTAMNIILNNIKVIIKEELERIGVYEVELSNTIPYELVKELGRSDDTLVKFVDSDNSNLAYISNKRELAIQLVRDASKSYSNYPVFIYENAHEFTRGKKASSGLFNLKESIINHIFSFHIDAEGLQCKTRDVQKAYENILKRCSLEEIYLVNDDAFVVLDEVGEEKVVVCDCCDYKSSFNKASSFVENKDIVDEKELELVVTPDVKTMSALCEFLDVDLEQTCKSVAYQKVTDNSFVVAFMRGDFDLNQSKLEALVGDALYPAELTEDSVLSGGFIGPVNLPSQVETYFDKSLKDLKNIVIGANEFDKHYTGYNVKRDSGDVEYVDITSVKDGALCPVCKEGVLSVKKGIELVTFKDLGEVDCINYLDKNGKAKHPIMAEVYVDLLKVISTICEKSHDEYGPVWPKSISPWKVQICCLRSDDEVVRQYADDLYHQLREAGVSVLYDDRKVRPGSMFSDADLFGVPLRVVVSPRNMKDSCVEISSRDKSYMTKSSLESAFDEIIQFLSK